MLGFRRPPVLGRSQFQPSDDLVVDVPHNQLSQLTFSALSMIARLLE